MKAYIFLLDPTKLFKLNDPTQFLQVWLCWVSFKTIMVFFFFLIEKLLWVRLRFLNLSKLVGLKNL